MRPKMYVQLSVKINLVNGRVIRSVGDDSSQNPCHTKEVTNNHLVILSLILKEIQPICTLNSSPIGHRQLIECLSTRLYDLILPGILLGTSYILFKICRNPFLISGSVLTVFKIIQKLYGKSYPKLFCYFFAHFLFGKQCHRQVKCKSTYFGGKSCKIFTMYRIIQQLEI